MENNGPDKGKDQQAFAKPKDGKEVDVGGVGRSLSRKTRKTSVTGGALREIGGVEKRRLSSFGLGNVEIAFQTNPDEIEKLNEVSIPFFFSLFVSFLSVKTS